MSTSTVSEKRTVITSSSGSSGSAGFDSIDDMPYKASFGTRASNIMARSSAPLRASTGGTHITRTVEYGYGSHMGGGMGPGGYSNVSNSGVNTVKGNREKEKKDLQDLNERFASYIEKVRFLEAQNRKLGSELDELRSKWGKETSQIKQMYEAELAEARRLIDDLSKDKAALEIKTSSMQEQFGDMQRQLDEAKKYRQVDRDQINKLNQQLADCESEISMLRRTIESLETERSRDKSTINRLQQDVDKLRIDLNNETLAHLDAENRRQTLEEEMEFMKKVHEQELKELASLAYRDTTAENREYWKSELGQAIRDIQQVYDSKVDQLRGDMEGFYNLKIQEYRTGATKQNMEVTHIREENKKLTKQMMDLRGKMADLEARNAQLEQQYKEALRQIETNESDYMMETSQLKEEIIKLRAEMEGILTELQTLMDAKLSLELEIAAYRKLLEGEENRADWRSRSSLIMYRDAFRPLPTERTEPESRKVMEPEKPIEAKTEKTVSHQREQREASPDTDAASSITMSDNEASVKDDEGDFEFEDKASNDTAVEKKSIETKEVTEIDENNVVNASGTVNGLVDSDKSPVIEHLVRVKEEISKIEAHAVLDETDSKLNEDGTCNETVSDEKHSPEIEKENDEKSNNHIASTEVTSSGDIIASKDLSPVEDVKELADIEDVVIAKAEVQNLEASVVTESKSDGSGTSDEIVAFHKETHDVKPDTEDIKPTEDTASAKNVDSETIASMDLSETSKSPVADVLQQNNVIDSVEQHIVIDETDSKTKAASADGEYAVDEKDSSEIKFSENLKSSNDDISSKSKDAEPDVAPDPGPVNEVMESVTSTSSLESTQNLEPNVKNESTDAKDNQKLETQTQSKSQNVLDKNEMLEMVKPESQDVVSKTTIDINQIDDTSEDQITSVAVKVDEKLDETNTLSKEIDAQEASSDPSIGDNTIALNQNDESKELESVEIAQMSMKVNEHDVRNENITSSENLQSQTYQSEVADKVESTQVEIDKTELLNDTAKDSVQEDRDIDSELKTNDVQPKVDSMNEYIDAVKEDKTSSDKTVKEISEKATKQDEIVNSEEAIVGSIVDDTEKLSTSPSPSTNSSKVDDESINETANLTAKSDSVISISQSQVTQERTQQSDQISVTNTQRDVQSKSGEEIVGTFEKEATVVSQERISEKKSSSSVTNTESNIVSLSEYTEIKSTQSNTMSEQISFTTMSDTKQLPIEKTEDKILESVVQSKIIETSPQDTARIEMSPTKELPGSNDKTLMDDSEVLAMNINVSEKVNVHVERDVSESQNGDQIEDDKTPEEDTNKAIGNDAKQSDPLVEVKEKSVEDLKIEEPQSSTADVQPVESTLSNQTVSNTATDKNEALEELDQMNETHKIDSETVDELIADKILNKEQDVMSQSFISENGQLTNGDIKDNGSANDMAASGSSAVDGDQPSPKPKIDETPKQTKEQEEENHVKETSDEPPKEDVVLQDKIQHMLQNGQDSQVSMKMMRGEVSAKTTYQRTSTGPIAISEVCPGGKFITLENTSSGPNKKDVNLDGWSLVRVVDGDRDYRYNFKNFTLKAGKKVKIVARGSASEAGLNDLVFRESNDWGVGKQVNTTLVNDKREEKASHVQNTNYN